MVSKLRIIWKQTVPVASSGRASLDADSLDANCLHGAVDPELDAQVLATNTGAKGGARPELLLPKKKGGTPFERWGYQLADPL